MEHDVTLAITGRSAADIAASVRSLIERGALRPGDPLPPVRNLADEPYAGIVARPNCETPAADSDADACSLDTVTA